MTSPYREAASGELGALRSVHKERSGFLLGVIFGGLSIAISTFAAYSGIPLSIAIAMAVVILFGATALYVIGKRNSPACIELFDRGIVSRAQSGSRTIKFDDVKSITSVKSQRRRAGVEQQMHIVEASDGSKIGFTLIYDNAIDLIDAINAATHERLRAEALKSYDAGEIVKFGPIAISEDGFFDGDRPVVAWSDIERAAIEMPQIGSAITWSEIKIWKKGEGEPIATRATERVPNATVLVDIIALAIQVEDDDTSD